MVHSDLLRIHERNMIGVAVRLTRVELATVRVNQRTDWAFAEFWDQDGAATLTEITCGAATTDVVQVSCGRDWP